MACLIEMADVWLRECCNQWMLADGSGVPEALWGAACVVIHMCVYLGLQQRSLRTASRALQKRSANSDKQSEHVNIF
jgi:hypothetical protein